MLERIHTKGANIKLATAPNLDECPPELKPLEYPFDLAWDKSIENRVPHDQVATAANALNIPYVECRVQASLVEGNTNITAPTALQQPIVVNSMIDTATD